MSTEKPSRDIDAPPDIPTLVRCNCCGEEYDSYLLIWMQPNDQNKHGKWCCPTEGCDGHGFRHDIVPLDEGEIDDPNWQHEIGDALSDMEPDLDEAFEAEMAAWENLEPEFSSLLGCDIEYRSIRVDGLLDDPTPPQRFDFDDISEDDIPF